MENELRMIEQLEPEQVIERAKAVMLEIDYWRHVLDDSAKVNDGVLAATSAVLEALAPALVLLSLLPPERQQLIAAIVEQLRVAVEQLKAIGDANGDTVDLADGRCKALEPVGAAMRRAAGLDPDGDEPAGQS